MNQKAKFECGGCTGLIRFEYKKDKGFATLQMKLLAAAERREKIKRVSKLCRTAALCRYFFHSFSVKTCLISPPCLNWESFHGGFPLPRRAIRGIGVYTFIGQGRGYR